jgi:hypothetical protein
VPAGSQAVLALGEREIEAELVRHARASRRLRLSVCGLAGDGGLARLIETELGRDPGIARVSADPTSGRMVIEYRPGAAVVARLGPRRAAGASRPDRGRRRLARGTGSIAIAAPDAVHASWAAG